MCKSQCKCVKVIANRSEKCNSEFKFVPPYTRHALLVVASKLNTNYDAKVMKGTCGAYIKVILFSDLLHTLRLFWKTATYKQMHVIQKLFGVS